MESESKVERSEFVEALVEAARAALAELAGAEVVVHSAETATLRQQADDISALVPLFSARGGYLVLTFPRPTATALARRIFAGVLDEPDTDLIRDCVGEIANVVAGQAKALLAATPEHFSFGVPTTTLGTVSESAIGAFFSTEHGEFSIRLIDAKG